MFRLADLSTAILEGGGRHRVQRRRWPVSCVLLGGDAPALCALAGFGAGILWELRRSARASALWLPVTILLTGLWQAYILEGHLWGALAIGHSWLLPALFGTASGLAIVGWRRQHGPGLPFAAAALSIVLAMPMARSIGSTLVRGNAPVSVSTATLPDWRGRGSARALGTSSPGRLPAIPS